MAVANAGIQWGRNLSKFGGIQLPGGTTLSGGEILAEYTKMKTETIAEIDTKYTKPLGMFLG